MQSPASSYQYLALALVVFSTVNGASPGYPDSTSRFVPPLDHHPLLSFGKQKQGIGAVLGAGNTRVCGASLLRLVYFSSLQTQRLEGSRSRGSRSIPEHHAHMSTANERLIKKAMECESRIDLGRQSKRCTAIRAVFDVTMAKLGRNLALSAGTDQGRPISNSRYRRGANHRRYSKILERLESKCCRRSCQSTKGQFPTINRYCKKIPLFRWWIIMNVNCLLDRKLCRPGRSTGY